LPVSDAHIRTRRTLRQSFELDRRILRADPFRFSLALRLDYGPGGWKHPAALLKRSGDQQVTCDLDLEILLGRDRLIVGEIS